MCHSVMIVRAASPAFWGRAEPPNDYISRSAALSLTRFDLVARGTFHGEGRYTRGAPPEPFPLAVSFTLAAPLSIRFKACS